MSLSSIAHFLHLPAASGGGKITENVCLQNGHQVACPTKNFLIPNGTFIFEWIVFLLVLVFLAKKIIPPIVKAIDQRADNIRKQFQDAEDAKTRLEKAEKDYAEALAETRREASRLREQAQAERAEIVEEARTEAQTRVEEMLENAEARIAAERQQAVLALRTEIGELATTLAERVVHDSLREDARQRKLVSDFIAGVGAEQAVGQDA